MRGRGIDVEADGADNVYAMGKFLGGIDFGRGPLSSPAFHDLYLAKLPP